MMIMMTAMIMLRMGMRIMMRTKLKIASMADEMRDHPDLSRCHFP